MKQIISTLLILLLLLFSACGKNNDQPPVGLEENENVAEEPAEQEPDDQDDESLIVPIDVAMLYFYKTTDNVNLREGPSTDFNKITTVPKGSTVSVTDFLDYEWFLVDYNGQAGYMKAEFLTEDAESTDGMLLNLFKIPYYGDRKQCRMLAEQAQAYANLIKIVDLKIEYSDYDGDDFFPVLLDVSGDGIPLLLLVVGLYPDEKGWLGFCGHYFLYGVEDGKAKRVEKGWINLSLQSRNEERLLLLMDEDSVEGSYERFKYYRVSNGMPELVFDAESQYWYWVDWPEYEDYDMDREYYYINSLKVSSEYFEEQICRNNIERLLLYDYDNLYVTASFQKYLVKTFTRDQAITIFQAYADSLI